MILSNEYWICKCKHNFIKHESQDYCLKCNCNQYEQPNPSLKEIIRYNLPYNINRLFEIK